MMHLGFAYESNQKHTDKHTFPFVCLTGAAVEGSDGSRDCCSYGGSGSCPPAAAAEQGLAAALGPARAAAERAGGPLPQNNTARAASTGAAS